MIRAKALFENRQRAAKQLRGLAGAVRGAEKKHEIVDLRASRPLTLLGAGVEPAISPAKWTPASHRAIEHAQRVAAERLEILLDLDLDVRARQRTAQRVAINSELAGGAGKDSLTP